MKTSDPSPLGCNANFARREGDKVSKRAFQASYPIQAAGSHQFSAFTLVEMLAVISVIAIMISLTGPVITNIAGGRDLRSNADVLAGLIEQARTNSISQGTYTYMYFAPKKDNSGFTVMALGSTQGIGNIADSVEFNSDLRLITKPYTFNSVVLSTVTGNHGNMAARSMNVLAFMSTPPSPLPTVSIPGKSELALVCYALRFNPRGEMEVPSANSQDPTQPSQWVIHPMTEIGLQSIKGNIQIASGVAALQITGLTGLPHIYLP